MAMLGHYEGRYGKIAGFVVTSMIPPLGPKKKTWHIETIHLEDPSYVNVA